MFCIENIGALVTLKFLPTEGQLGDVILSARNPLAFSDRNPSPASRLVTAELRGRMKDLLAELSEEERTVVLLKYLWKD